MCISSFVHNKANCLRIYIKLIINFVILRIFFLDIFLNSYISEINGLTCQINFFYIIYSSFDLLLLGAKEKSFLFYSFSFTFVKNIIKTILIQESILYVDKLQIHFPAKKKKKMLQIHFFPSQELIDIRLLNLFKPYMCG